MLLGCIARCQSVHLHGHSDALQQNVALGTFHGTCTQLTTQGGIDTETLQCGGGDLRTNQGTCHSWRPGDPNGCGNVGSGGSRPATEALREDL